MLTSGAQNGGCKNKHMTEYISLREELVKISRETGLPIKKLSDFLFILRDGKSIENNYLVQKTGISKNALNQAKKLLSFLLKPPSDSTQLRQEKVKQAEAFFETGYQLEETLWSFLENKYYEKTLDLLKKYRDCRPSPDRKYDQFTATAETTARRVSLLNFFEDITCKRLLFLGDDDFTSIAAANLRKAANVTVLDIDNRILDAVNTISKSEKLNIETSCYDTRKPLPKRYEGKFNVVFTDPPYTPDGIKLFVSRSIQALNSSNNEARIYVCYGNSDRAKERFLPIYKVFTDLGLMVRWVLDKFNRYQGAESIGSSSSLFILDLTSKTKPAILGEYAKPIYTNN